MILPRYDEPFASLPPAEIQCLIKALGLPPFPRSGRPWTGTDIIQHCREQHISHADVVMSLYQDTSVEAVSAVERLIMRPIDRRTPYEVNISRLARPPGSHRTASNPTGSASPSRAGDDMVIRLLAETNPKRPGSDSHVRFAYYSDGMTVAAYLQKGGRRPDLAWDSDKGFIRLEEPTAVTDLTAKEGQADA